MLSGIFSMVLAAALLVQTEPSCIPEDYDGALDCLDELLTAESKSQLDGMAYNELLGRTHFGLGMWIRNNWIYPDTPLAQELRDTGFQHADDMSGVVVEGYWARRQGCELSIENWVAFYDAYWQSQEQLIESEPDPETGIVEIQVPPGGLRGIPERPRPECDFPLDQTPPARGSHAEHN
ncbi:DUF6794 domain-containing protein [Glycocaulis abyssi]|uniref:DUF6794 domain-containing protein n=1 Tax=Glycocaulis abyssi TaxID=1433403 RepID=A0ABV9N9X4_9PROT